MITYAGPRGIFPDGLLERREGLVARADKVLRKNDMGTWTKAAPGLYPHQWSWHSAFIALGLSRLDTRRTAGELPTLFEHQWKYGKVPHIVFSPEALPDSYCPGRTIGLAPRLPRCATLSALHQLPLPTAHARDRRLANIGERRS